MQRGELTAISMGRHAARSFSSTNACCTTSCSAYYSHPHAWSEIGFGGPASPRGYVRMDFDRRDPWEAAEAEPGQRRQGRARRTSVSDDARASCRAASDGRAPDVFRPGGWVPMREYPDDEQVDFAIVGTGAGGGTLACRLAELGFSVVAFDAGRIGGRSRISPPTRPSRPSSTGPTSASVDGDNPISSAVTTAASPSAAARCISPWCRCAFALNGSSRAALLGYGADWPLDWREMWRYYARGRAGAEDLRPGELSLGAEAAALSVSGARTERRGAGAGARRRGARHRLDARRRWPPCRRRAATRHPASIAASARSAARPTPSRARSSRGFRARSPPAPKSAIWRWSGVSRPTPPGSRPASTISAKAAGSFQRAKNVVVAGYAIETPRLLLMSANSRFPTVSPTVRGSSARI